MVIYSNQIKAYILLIFDSYQRLISVKNLVSINYCNVNSLLCFNMTQLTFKGISYSPVVAVIIHELTSYLRVLNVWCICVCNVRIRHQAHICLFKCIFKFIWQRMFYLQCVHGTKNLNASCFNQMHVLSCLCIVNELQFHTAGFQEYFSLPSSIQSQKINTHQMQLCKVSQNKNKNI